MGAGDEYLTRSWPKIFAEHGPAALDEALSRWTQADAKPLVLLIDEIDALVGDTLLAVLRQLRAGYHMRSKGFPQSAILCGVRDVRDYRIHSGSANTLVSGGSAFNIKSESLRLGDFTPDEVRALLGQHTAETGQPFTEDALDAVWIQTRGQPWLVNALAYEACFRGPLAADRTRAVTEADVLEAREQLIQRRDTHLDQLTEEFFREHSESWVERFDYKEAGPHLLLQAFLQRVVNSGGRIGREPSLGRGRTDLLIECPRASACSSTWSSARFGTTAEAWNAPWPTGSSRRHGTWTDAEPRRATWSSPTAARNGPGTRRCSATAGPPRVAWRLRFGGCSDGGGRDRGPCGRYRGLTSITITHTKRRWSGDSCSWSRSSSLSGDFGRVPVIGAMQSPNQKTR